MKLYTLALVGVLGMFGISAQAQTCGVLCDEGFWKSASEAEVKAEISKADVNARNKAGLTSLMLAATFGTAENVKVLLDAGADVNARDEDGLTSLMLAAESGSTTEALKVLLDAGADVNARDEDGDTAWDNAQYNEKLKDTEAYWMLNDARFK